MNDWPDSTFLPPWPYRIYAFAASARPLEDCGSVSISIRSCLLCLDVGSQKNWMVISFGFSPFTGFSAKSPLVQRRWTSGERQNKLWQPSMSFSGIFSGKILCFHSTSCSGSKIGPACPRNFLDGYRLLIWEDKTEKYELHPETLFLL